MIEVSGLTKDYGERRAIDDLSFRIERGQIVGFLGLNGAGKTTALKILAGYLLPTAGAVQIDGVDLVASPERLRARIGYLPEVPPLYTEMTVRAYLRFLGRLRGMGSAALERRMADVLDRTALTDRADDVIGTLSLGYRKRVGIAQAILHEPVLVILDEPISGLDPQQIAQMRQLVRSLRGDHTVLISSHILTEVEETCDHLLMLASGKIIAQGTEQDIVTRFRASRLLDLDVRGPQAEVLAFLREHALVQQADLTAQEGEIGKYRLALKADEPEAIAQAVVGRGFGLRRLDAPRGELEQAFLSLTGKGASA